MLGLCIYCVQDSRELISSSESSDEEDASHGKSVRKKSTKKRVPPKW